MAGSRSPSGPSLRARPPLVRPDRCPTRAAAPAVEHHRRPQGEVHHRGCQDQARPARQDPRAVLPRRRRRCPHPPQRPGDRVHRQVPPEVRPQRDRDQLRSRAVLAERRRAADRVRAVAAEGDRGLAEVQGPAGRRGHAAGPEGQAGQEGAVRVGAVRRRWRRRTVGDHAEASRRLRRAHERPAEKPAERTARAPAEAAPAAEAADAAAVEAAAPAAESATDAS